METTVVMPAFSPTMTEGNLLRWLKAEGEAVKVGDPLVEIETDKTVVEIEASESGVLLRVLVADGSEGVAVNSPIAIIASEAAPPQPETPRASLAGETADAKSAGAPQERLSPNAKRLAREAATAGAAPASTNSSAAGADTDRPHERILVDSMRRAIAARVVRSATQVPQFDSSVDIDMGRAEQRRIEFNSDAGRHATVNDVMVRALALALQEHPEANASWLDEHVARWKVADISVIVAVEGGLAMPVLRDAHAKSLAQVSNECADLVGRARAGQLQPSDSSGGTFSISNAGVQGARQFNAVVSPPQGGIVAIGRAEDRPVVKNGQLGIARQVTATLTVDHRVIDGGLAARLLNTFKRLLEEADDRVFA